MPRLDKAPVPSKPPVSRGISPRLVVSALLVGATLVGGVSGPWLLADKDKLRSEFRARLSTVLGSSAKFGDIVVRSFPSPSVCALDLRAFGSAGQWLEADEACVDFGWIGFAAGSEPSIHVKSGWLDYASAKSLLLEKAASAPKEDSLPPLSWSLVDLKSSPIPAKAGSGTARYSGGRWALKGSWQIPNLGEAALELSALPDASSWNAKASAPGTEIVLDKTASSFSAEGFAKSLAFLGFESVDWRDAPLSWSVKGVSVDAFSGKWTKGGDHGSIEMAAGSLVSKAERLSEHWGPKADPTDPGKLSAARILDARFPWVLLASAPVGSASVEFADSSIPFFQGPTTFSFKKGLDRAWIGYASSSKERGSSKLDLWMDPTPKSLRLRFSADSISGDALGVHSISGGRWKWLLDMESSGSKASEIFSEARGFFDASASDAVVRSGVLAQADALNGGVVSTEAAELKASCIEIHAPFVSGRADGVLAGMDSPRSAWAVKGSLDLSVWSLDARAKAWGRGRDLGIGSAVSAGRVSGSLDDLKFELDLAQAGKAVKDFAERGFGEVAGVVGAGAPQRRRIAPASGCDLPAAAKAWALEETPRPAGSLIDGAKSAVGDVFGKIHGLLR